ncbi:MAG: aldehyde dehydrogenase family protein [Proteobacteria bacterium]|nr:aldehyde dehydrogenase family protein [Pseudomonadota bacterium]
MAQSAVKFSQTEVQSILKQLGIDGKNSGACGAGWMGKPGGATLVSLNPSDGQALGEIVCASNDDYDRVVSDAQAAYVKWRSTPAPVRGEIVRQLGEEFRRYKEPLGKLISLEMGKILSEGLGEVQEAIDICDFAVGLSRQLYGLTMHSERPGHRMYEQWHPLGTIGIITAFNFPCAVWAWNAAIAAVCGDTMVWKPSEKTPLITVAMMKIVHKVLADHGHAGVMGMVISPDRSLGERMAADKRLPLISATGSTRMGREVGRVVAERFGKSLLELGGNNAIIVMDDADLDLATRAIVFGACGTTGQRCTTTRRIFVQEKLEKALLERLQKAYGSVKIGHPLEKGVLMGPLIDRAAVEAYKAAVAKAQKEGGKLLCGGKELAGEGFFVEPTIISAKNPLPIMQEETFAPILYVTPVRTLDEAIDLQNNVPQGLSSAVFTQSLKSAEKFLSTVGSDCGIANVNIGTSGAEIGGAFGGEKETGGGRESGSDSWKAYMRRQTCTINYSDALPLAQGVEFL